MVENNSGASPFVTTMWSSNLQKDKNALYPALPCRSSSSSSSKSNLYRYLPNEHHRIIASVALNYRENLAYCPASIAAPNSVSCAPRISRDSTADEYSNLGANLDYNIVCQNNNLSYSDRSIGFSVTNGLALPDVRMPSDIYRNITSALDKPSALEMTAAPYLTTGSSIYSNDTQPSSGNDSSSVNPDGLYHCSDMQTEPQLLSNSINRVMSSDMNAQSHTPTVQCRSPSLLANNDIQQSCLRPHTSHNHFDEHSIFLKENSNHDRYLSIEERGSSYTLQCLSQRNTSIQSEQTPTEPSEANSFLKNSPQSLSPVKECTEIQNSDIKEDEMMASHSRTKRERIILQMYEHVRSCRYEGQECPVPRCMKFKNAFKHVFSCRDLSCKNGCIGYNWLINHYKGCSDSACSTCGPVRKKLNEDFQKSNVSAGSKTAFPSSESIGDEQSMAKRIKTAHQPLSPLEENKSIQASFDCSPQLPQAAQADEEQIRPLDSETDTGQLLKQSEPCLSANTCTTGNKDEDLKVETQLEAAPVPSPSAQVDLHPLQENIINNEFPTPTMDTRCKFTSSTDLSVSVSEKKNVVSLLHTFTSQKIREHIRGLVMDQDKSKADYAQMSDENTKLCSLCRTSKLLFEPLPKYCASCLKLINPKGVYYSIKSDSCHNHDDNAKIFLCGKCYGTSGESFKFGGKPFRKTNLERNWNYADDAEHEPFVRCHKCKAWQHTICALFNKQSIREQQEGYTCSSCYLQDLENGKCEPLQKNLVLGAKDLPRTALSNYIEKRVFNRLEQEREQRAFSLGMRTVEVPGAEGLVIRVVSSINKKLEVNPLFREIFADENYPSEFPYKSKAILLFQNIEGSEICLFAMYVQEYGSECPQPNQRRLCISYIDSVKFFRPEVKAVTGEALRTFVYHEILIGYLDYSKKRGFTSCYIWSCPPEREDYYIFYCHPKSQKSPKPDKLREWYQSMIRKAMKESIVLEKTNLHEHFFVPASECKAKVTAARLPYFDSDYWPGQAEILLKKENENDLKTKGAKAAIERALRAAKRDASTGNPKDILLMHQLGEKFQKMKEDFIVVHLQPECRHCCQPMVCGKQWFCNTCKNFQLCEQCYDKEANLEKKDKHPIAAREKHSFRSVESSIIANTADKDEVMKSDYFDMRTELLSFCQSNHYQFDSLRRAKHSTMMIVFHLHSSLNILSPCAVCHCDCITNQGWCCMTCHGYVLCSNCFHEHGSLLHEHKLISGKVKKQVLDVLLHASRCAETRCTSYPYCLALRKMFRHCRECTIRFVGGCLMCRKVWYVLVAHARACRELECHIPRCSDLKDWEAQIATSKNQQNRKSVGGPKEGFI